MKLKFNLEIGIRTLKTSIAILVSIVLSNIFGFSNPFLAAISALIVMETSVVDTFRSGKYRIIDSIFGATIAYLFCLIKPGDMLLTALGIIVIISLADILKWENTVITSGIIFLSIMFGVKAGIDPLSYSLSSVLETFLGIVIAFTINFLIAPPDHIPSVIQSYQVLHDKANYIIEKRVYYNERIDTFGFYDMIEELSTKLDTLLEEIRLSKDKPLHAENIKESIFLYKHIYFHLTILNDTSENVCLSKENINKYKGIYGKAPENTFVSPKEEYIVFNYHVSKILDAIIALQGLPVTRKKH